jgi:NADPH-dependent curcumin reductase CurA
MSLANLVNHQIRLAARPVGMPKATDWSHTTEAVAEPAEGGVVLKTLALSLDPAMRGWMNEGKSYIPPSALVKSCAPAVSARSLPPGTTNSPWATM